MSSYTYIKEILILNPTKLLLKTMKSTKRIHLESLYHCLLYICIYCWFHSQWFSTVKKNPISSFIVAQKRLLATNVDTLTTHGLLENWSNPFCWVGCVRLNFVRRISFLLSSLFWSLSSAPESLKKYTSAIGKDCVWVKM